MTRLPVSLLFIPLTFLAYLLAYIPVINFVLLILLLPFWPTLIVNGGLVQLVIEVFLRKLSLLWLILPLGWFGSYGAMAWSDNKALTDLRAEVATSNAAVSVPFQPSQQNLVYVEGSPNDSLIQNYGLSVLYSKNSGDEGGYRSTRMVSKNVCDKLRDRSFTSAGIYTSGLHEESDVIAGGKFEQRFCMVSMREQPESSKVLVSVKERTANYRQMPVTYSDTTIIMPNGSKYQLLDGQASPMGWIPMPVIEYNPMSSSSVPKFSFYRSHFTPLNTEAGQFTSATATLARVLGLNRVTPADRKAGSSSVVSDQIDTSQRDVVLDETAKLDRALADVQAEIGSVPFNSLYGRLDIILPRLEKIVAAVERGVAEQHNGRNNAQQMFHLLEQAPADEIAPYRDRIDELKDQDNWFKFHPESAN